MQVDDRERIVRAICTPYHVRSNGKLKWQAFDPPAGSDEVSVIRHDYISASECKFRGKQLAVVAAQKEYKGLAVIMSAAVRRHGADVVDSRDVYIGHADIKHGIRRDRLEPPPPEILQKLKQRCESLLAATTYYPDPNPTAEGWLGPNPLPCGKI